MDNIWTFVFLLNVYSCVAQTIQQVQVGTNATFTCLPDNTKQVSFFTWATNQTSLASTIAFFANISGSCQQQGAFNTSLYAATCSSTAGPYLFYILNIEKTHEGVVVRCAVSYTDSTTVITDKIIQISSSSCQGSCCQCGHGCCICNIFDKLLFAVIFIIVDLLCFGLCEILCRKYTKCFRLEKLDIGRNSQPAKIAPVKISVDGSEIAQNWNYSDNHEHSFCNTIFDKTRSYQCDVTLDNQQNLTFDFDFKGCENDKNVATFIMFEKKITMNGETVSVEWILKKEITWSSKTFLFYQAKTRKDYMPEINIVISFDFTIPDLDKRVTNRICIFIIICCIIAFIDGIITGVLQNEKVEGFCCTAWVIPVALIASLLTFILLYVLLLILLVKKVHGRCIVVKCSKESPVVHPSPDEVREFLLESIVYPESTHTAELLEKAGENKTARYIGNSLLDKKPYNQPLPNLMQVENTNKFPPVERGNKLQPIQQAEDPDNLVTETGKKKKSKKKTKSEQEFNDNKDGIEDKM